MRTLSQLIDSMLWPNLTVRGGAALTLQPGQVCSVERAAGWVVQLDAGCLWLTETGDAADYCLTRGQRHAVRSRGLLVIQCMGSEAARFELKRLRPDAAGGSCALAKPVRRCAHFIQAPTPEHPWPSTALRI